MSDYKFTCPACGQHLMGDESYAGMQIACPSCQLTMTVPPPPQAAAGGVPRAPSPPPPPPPPPAAAARPAPPPPRRPAAPPGSASPGPKRKTSGLAVASLVCSCATLVAGPLGAIPGIICGHLARARLRRDPSLGGQGLAKAGLIVGYSLLGVMVVWMGFLVLALVKGMNQGMQQVMEQAARPPKQESRRPRGRKTVETLPVNPQTSVPVDKTPDGSGWTLDLAGAEIPSTPAQGRVHGRPFTVERVSLQGGWLKLRQGRDFIADMEFGVVLFENDVNRLASRTFTMPGEQRMTPHIWVNWKEEGTVMPKQTSFTQQYAMRLEFGPISNGRLPGKIYLCVPDAEKSFVRGVFEVDTKPSTTRPEGGVPRPRQGTGGKTQTTTQ